MKTYTVKMVTKIYGDEISWSIGGCSGNGYKNNDSYSKTCSTPRPATLVCKDSYGDGWHGAYIEIEGKKYCEGFKSGRQWFDQIPAVKICEKTPLITPWYTTRILRILKAASESVEECHEEA